MGKIFSYFLCVPCLISHVTDYVIILFIFIIECVWVVLRKKSKSLVTKNNFYNLQFLVLCDVDNRYIIILCDVYKKLSKDRPIMKTFIVMLVFLFTEEEKKV